MEELQPPADPYATLVSHSAHTRVHGYSRLTRRRRFSGCAMQIRSDSWIFPCTFSRHQLVRGSRPWIRPLVGTGAQLGPRCPNVSLVPGPKPQLRATGGRSAWDSADVRWVSVDRARAWPIVRINQIWIATDQGENDSDVSRLDLNRERKFTIYDSSDRATDRLIIIEADT